MSILDSLFGKKKKEEETEQAGASILPVLPEEIYQSAKLELQDIIAPSALKIEPKSINLGDKIARTFFIISYPRYLSDNWFSPIINLDKVFDVSIFVQPIDTSLALRQFQKKVAEVQSQINVREAKGMVRDPMLDTAYQDLEGLRDNLIQAQEKMFDVGVYITIYADNSSELFKIENEIKSMLESKLIYIKPALFQQDVGFKSVIPLGNDILQVNQKLNSEPLSSIFPFVSFDLTSDKGILYGVNRHNSSLVIFDRFSLENYNSVTFAKSGSGKSVEKFCPVLIRKNGEVRLVPIGKIVDETIKKQGKTQIDEEMEGTINPGLEVWSFDKNLKGSWSNVTIAARKTAPNIYYRFITKSGREITTTADHNMLVLRKGKVEVAKSTDVALGEYIPLPRTVSIENTGTDTINLLELFAKKKGLYVIGINSIIKKNYTQIKRAKLDSNFDKYLYKYAKDRRMPIDYFLKILALLEIPFENDLLKTASIISASGKGILPITLRITKPLARLLGYITAEGTITERVISISNIDKEVLNDIKNCYKEIGVSCYEVKGAISTASRPFIKLIHAICGEKQSKTKTVPPLLFNCSKKIIAEFLQTYFEGDGGVEKGSVTALSKSKELISGLSYLLYFFGITTRVHKREKKYTLTGRKRIFWYLSISGQENLQTFTKKINFATKRKRRALQKLLGVESNTNVDVIPGISPLIEELRNLFGSQLHNITNISPLSRGIYSPSPSELQKLIHSIEERVHAFKKIEPAMATMESLPLIEDLIKLGESNKEQNSRLWRELGSSWAWMKKRKGEPGLANVLALARVALRENEGERIESAAGRIHQSFLDFDSSIKEQGSALGSAFRKNLPDRTSYEMLRQAALFTAETYQNILTNLPRIEEILGLMRNLAVSDLFWDPIVSIKSIINKRDKYVYDLTVDNEVFLAGSNGMFIHNSYATKLEILRSLMFDVDVIVIDPEKEYEYLAEAVGGRYFSISLSSDHHINPFDLPIPHEDESAEDVLRSNVINLVGLFRLMLGGLTPEEDAMVDRAISETYALKDITPESDFSNIEPPLLSDFEMVLGGMEGSDSVMQRLVKYTKGSWSTFINKPSNVDINKKFVVFSVRDMEDELKPVAMYIVMHYIWTAIRKNLKKRLLVVDEAWWMMKSEDTASFLYSIAKRGRKYYLGLATITQDVGDFMKSPYGVPIVTNSSIQLLLKQSPSTIDVLVKTFNLTDEEKYLLLESDIGEGIFFAGLKHVAIKIIASYTEDQIITSDPSQILSIKKAKDELEEAENG